MTINNETNVTLEENSNHQGIILHNEEQYLSSSKVKLDHKWQYDLDTEAFLRHLPKVSNLKCLKSRMDTALNDPSSKCHLNQTNLSILFRLNCMFIWTEVSILNFYIRT